MASGCKTGSNLGNQNLFPALVFAMASKIGPGCSDDFVCFFDNTETRRWFASLASRPLLNPEWVHFENWFWSAVTAL